MTIRHTVDSITSDALDQLYADLDRYEEVVGELNEANTGLARQAARAEAVIARVQRLLDSGPIGTCCDYLLRAALDREQPAPAPAATDGRDYVLTFNHPPTPTERQQITNTLAGNHTSPSRVVHTTSTTPPTENP
ncbi:hypothetical protein [Streptomyces rochei]|uniref:hypothetical protein n=1 Tax=Streptomyces rochei TaxID=1928 RepID=UPI0037011EB5